MHKLPPVYSEPADKPPSLWKAILFALVSFIVMYALKH